jgi:hypothetical protein
MARTSRIAISAVAFSFLIAGCTAMRSQTTITVPEVEKKIDYALPVGSTREKKPEGTSFRLF